MCVFCECVIVVVCIQCLSKFPTHKLITTYGGVTLEGESIGIKTFPADNFEPYIRTMPHAEYPSGSSCICSGWSNAMQEIYGTDDLTSDVGEDGLFVTFNAFSSIKEPLSTPSEDITVNYHSFSEIGTRCAQTRLEGGMHFTASVPDGIILCQDIGIRVAQHVQSLANGIVPDYNVDIDDVSVNQRDCYPDSRGDSSRSGRRSGSRSSSESSSG